METNSRKRTTRHLMHGKYCVCFTDYYRCMQAASCATLTPASLCVIFYFNLTWIFFHQCTKWKDFSHWFMHIQLTVFNKTSSPYYFHRTSLLLRYLNSYSIILYQVNTEMWTPLQLRFMDVVEFIVLECTTDLCRHCAIGNPVKRQRR